MPIVKFFGVSTNAFKQTADTLKKGCERMRIKAQKAAGKKPERMWKVGGKGAPTAKAFRQSAKTARS